MNYDFDQHIDRVETNDVKWHTTPINSYLNHQVHEDMIPMWIADTDFACPAVVLNAIKERVDKKIFGYCDPMEDFYSAVCWWQKRRFDFDILPEWITMSPTVVASTNIAIRAFSELGDGIIIQQPVYDPFVSIIERNKRVVVNNSLLYDGKKYTIDYDLLERQAAEKTNKILILCSPHNPVGRVWKVEELRRVADICLAHNVLIVCDEIHSDIVFSGYKHYPLLSLDKSYADAFIQLGAPGKTFNIAGLKTGYAIIPSKKLRTAFVDMQIDMSLDIHNTFSLESLVAAYTPMGEKWMLEELEYLEKNVDFTYNFVIEKMPGAKMLRPEGTFLCWLDLTNTELTDEELMQKVIIDGGVVCGPGAFFGKGGENHLRLNVGCPRDILKIALEKIALAISK